MIAPTVMTAIWSMTRTAFRNVRDTDENSLFGESEEEEMSAGRERRNVAMKSPPTTSVPSRSS